jgi:predicted DNA-binding transcriptional regulator YafY
MVGRPSLITPQLVQRVALLTGEGLSTAKAAQATGVSARTVERARAAARESSPPTSTGVEVPPPADVAKQAEHDTRGGVHG